MGWSGSAGRRAIRKAGDDAVAAMAASGGAVNPVRGIAYSIKQLQAAPPIGHSGMAESFIPVWGPGRDSLADLQEHNYGGAALNGGMAVADAFGVGVGAKGARAGLKGIGAWKTGAVTSDAAIKQMKKRGMVRPGEEVHHTAALDGVGRNTQDWRNHYAFLKPLPKAIHRRLHGSWGGKPMYDPIRKVWYGTTDWMKAMPPAAAAYVGNFWENSTDPDDAAQGRR